MTVPLPTSIASSSQWQVTDWLDRCWTGVADSSGVALVTLPVLADNQRWLLTHMVCGATSTAQTQMRLYLDSVANQCLRDGSNSGNFDVADWSPGLMVPPSRSLIARWSGCNPSDTVFLSVQATILQRNS